MLNERYLTDVLHQAGLRATAQRMAIYKLLMQTNTHPSVNDIYSQLKEHFPTLSLATVYNTLNVLMEMGFVNALGSIGDDKVHLDGNLTPHINLACVKCHEIIDLQSELVEKMNAEIHQKSGYKVMGERVLYYGICPRCRRTTSACR